MGHQSHRTRTGDVFRDGRQRRLARLPAVLAPLAALSVGLPAPGHGSDAEPAFRVSALPALDDSRVRQVVVTSEALAAGFEAFAADQTRRGVPTVVRTVSSIESSLAGPDSPARIREFLREAHRVWGTRYVLLGGGPEHVPVRYVPWGAQILPTDLYYACLDGSWNEDGDGVYGEPNDLADYTDVINDVAIDAEDRIWLATYAGVVGFQADRFSVFDRTLGLPSNHVLTVDTGPDGTVWAGTVAGAARLTGGTFETFDSSGGLPSDRVLAVLAVGPAEVWVGTDRGVGHFDGQTWRVWGVPDGLPSDLVTGLTRDGDDVWVGTRRGVARIADGLVAEVVSAELASDHVTCVATGPDGTIWVGHAAGGGSPGGVSRRVGSGWVTDDLAGWDPVTVRGFAFDAAGDIWLATNGGLIRGEPGPVPGFEPIEGLPVASVSAVAVTSAGGLALASASGFLTGEPGAWNVYTADVGLPRPAPEGDDVDLQPELVVGRLPVRDRAELDVYLAKFRAYVRGDAADRVDHVLVHAEVLSPGLDGRSLAEDALSRVPPRYGRHELYESAGTLDAERLASALASGWGLAIHVCHGSYDVIGAGSGLELLFNSDLDAVDSGGRFALHLVEGCRIGGFDHDCSAGHLLLNPRGGAIAVIANTRDALARTDSSFDLRFLERLFASDHGRPAEAWCETVSEKVAADPERFRLAGSERRVLLTRTYLGPPALSVWRAVPHAATVVHSPDLPVGVTPFPVQVTDPASGDPVRGALVCLSKGDEVYVYGRTDSSGVVTLEARPATPGSMDVSVTAPDLLPYEGAAIVHPGSGPRLLVDGWQWSSPGPGPRGIRLEIRNAGPASAPASPLRLTSAERRVTVIHGAGSLGELGPGESGFTSEFLLQCDLAHGARFPVFLRSTGGPAFAETVPIEVEAPDLIFAGFVRSGDRLRARLSNRGGAATGALVLTLEAASAGTLVLDGAAVASPIPARTVRVLEDSFRVEGDPAGALRLTVRDSDVEVLSLVVDLEPPRAPASARSAPRSSGSVLTWERVLAPDLAGYRILVRDGSGPWEPALGGVAVAEARAEIPVPPGAGREVAIVSLDHSGNESADSCFVVAHSIPPSLPGWPAQLSAAAGPSPVIAADLDGNGRSEVLFGSMWEANALHVLRSDGTEWSDGDSDPSTTGIFARTGERVTAAPLAVDIDGDRVLEIFVASADGSVHGWRSAPDASGLPVPLPGWPVFHDERGVRVPPVAGDLDGDGDLEIVTVADDGWIRAFEADASMVAGWPRANGRPAAGSAPAILDLNGDGKDDVIFGVPTGDLMAISGDGDDLPGWPFPVAAGVASSPVLADLDGDGDPEILALDGDGLLWGLHTEDRDSDGLPDLLAGWPVATGPIGRPGHSPALADFDADGLPEVVLNGSDAIWVLRGDGTSWPGWPLPVSDGVNSPVLADLDGDGTPDLLVGSGDRRLTAYALDGTILPGWPLELLEEPSSTPYVADVDDDGDLDVLMTANDALVRALDLCAPAAAGSTPWPGFHGGLRLDGVYRPPARTPGAALDPRPGSVVLLAPRPNPFRGSVSLGLALPHAAAVDLRVYDVRGRLVARPVEWTEMAAGVHFLEWDGRALGGGTVASGVYFLRLRAGERVLVRRLLRVR